MQAYNSFVLNKLYVRNDVKLVLGGVKVNVITSKSYIERRDMWYIWFYIGNNSAVIIQDTLILYMITQIDIQNLEKEMYIVQIDSEKSGKYSMKLIKK